MKERNLIRLKGCLEDVAAAGTDRLANDPRLHMAVNVLAAPAARDPAYAGIVASARRLMTAEPDERPALLLDTATLVIETLRARAQAEVSGPFMPLEPGRGCYTDVAYSKVRPLIEALTGTGSARLTILEDEWAAHPEYFSDLRVQRYLTTMLGETNEELEELLVEILTELGPSVVPALEEGFTPEVRREMARRVYWAAKLGGEEANGWLLSILPDCRGEVRETALAALGVSQFNAPLLRDLYLCETGKSQNAVLRALAWMNDDESRALWTEELERRPDCPPCLEGVTSPLAADMAALVLRDTFSEALERGRQELTQAELLTLAHAVYAAYGKYSEALREEWLWLAEQMGALEQLRPDRTVRHWDLTAADMLEKCLLETVLWNPSEELRALTQELARRAPGHFLGAALLIELLSHPDTAYDAYGKFIVKNGLLHKENAAERANRVQLMRALGAVRYDPVEGRHIPFSRKDPLTGAPLGRVYHLQDLDTRWYEALSNPKVNRDGAVFDLSEPWEMDKKMFDLDWIAPPEAMGQGQEE